VLAYVAGDVVLELGQVRAFGLRHIEDIYSAEANQHGLRFGVVVRSAVLVGVVLVAPFSDHRARI